MSANVSIIIVSYNTADLLRRAISSVYSYIVRYGYEIIVVDNASSDDSVSVLEHEFTDVILIKNSDNVGFAKANNQAMRIAQVDYVVLLNSDAFILDHDFESLLDFMEQHGDIAATGPRVLNTDGTLQSLGFSFPSVRKELIGLFRLPKFMKPATLNALFPRYFWDENSARPVDWISGCCMLMRRTVIDAVGALSEDFFMYHEDEEWCYRARRAGFHIWYYPAASVIHDNNASPMMERSEIGRSSTKIYLRKTFGILKGVLIQCICLTSNVVACTFSALTLRAARFNEYAGKINSQALFIRFLLTSDVKK
jgi:GT2 family glycosyltransferase